MMQGHSSYRLAIFVILSAGAHAPESKNLQRLMRSFDSCYSLRMTKMQTCCVLPLFSTLPCTSAGQYEIVHAGT